MATTTSDRTDVEQVLVEVASLLLERARMELERAVGADDASASSDAASNLARMRELEDALRAVRRARSVAGPPAATASGRQVSKFYEVPGQEDA
jgi:hypothetical protein